VPIPYSRRRPPEGADGAGGPRSRIRRKKSTLFGRWEGRSHSAGHAFTAASRSLASVRAPLENRRAWGIRRTGRLRQGRLVGTPYGRPRDSETPAPQTSWSRRNTGGVPARPLEDRWCHARALNNVVRRWLFPPEGDLDLLGLAPGQSVADVGAGPGYFAPEELLRIGPSGTLWLVDPDRENLDWYRSRHPPDSRVRYLVSSAAELGGIPSGSQDRVLLSLVLCCSVRKEEILDEIWRILRPGGRALVTYPRIRLIPWRRTGLAVRPERWAQILARRPWQIIRSDRRRGVARHLLEVPENRTGPSPRSTDVTASVARPVLP
jgi:SAM-dependent methyltransferase